MSWTDLVSYFSGGLFLANAIPHLVSSQTRRPFQSAFAGPRGEGLSLVRVNVLWGACNLAVARPTRARRPPAGCSSRSIAPGTSAAFTAATIPTDSCIAGVAIPRRRGGS